MNTTGAQGKYQIHYTLSYWRIESNSLVYFLLNTSETFYFHTTIFFKFGYHSNQDV